MALMQTGTVGSSSPLLAYELHATNISASGTMRTIRVTVKFKVNGSSSSWYGYACNWRAVIQTPYEFVYGGWSQFKGNESWNGGQGYREFSQDITFDSRTTGSIAVRPGFDVDNSHGWRGSVLGPNLGTVQTNTAPYWGSGASISISGVTVTNGYIPENTKTINLSWPRANDNEGDSLTYALNLSTNGGGYVQVRNNGNLSEAAKVNGGEGTKYQWYVDACDTSGAWSSKIYTNTITKNTFTPDRITTTTNSLSYSGNNSVFAFTCSGAKNTNGNTTFTRKVTCNEVTLYNSAVSGTSFNVTVWRTGATAPSGPYVKWTDILNLVRNNSYKGNLTFVLTTTNAYGTAKSTSCVIPVNLQTAPNPATNQQISTVQTESTNYLTVADTGNKYFIPDGKKVTRIKWSAGSGKLGETIKYELYVAYGASGSWTKIADIPQGTNYYNHVVPKQSASITFKYLVRTICTYNTSLFSDAQTPAQTLHYYNGISFTNDGVTRTASSADVKVTIKSLTSIPNVNISGGYMVFNNASPDKPMEQHNLPSTAQGAQTIKVTGLSDSGTYRVTITIHDSTGLTDGSTTGTVSIGPNAPVFFINKYGVGVGGNKADSTCSLNVKGLSRFSGDIVANGNFTFGANKGLATNNKTFIRNDGTATVLSSQNNTMFFRPKGDGDSTNQVTINTSGALTAPSFISNDRSRLAHGYYVHSAKASAGNAGYINIAQIKLNGTYLNSPTEIRIHQRGRMGTIYIQFANVSNNDAGIGFIKKDGNINAYIQKSATSTWQLWVQKAEPHDTIDVMDISKGPHSNKLQFTWKDVFATALPSGCTTASPYVDANLFKEIYPVGAIYMSTSSTNPSSLFGGTWEAWGSGRVPVGVNANDGDFNTPNKTGGSKTMVHNHGSGSLRANIGAYDANIGSIGYQATNSSGVNYTYGIRATADSNISANRVNHATTVSGATENSSTSTSNNLQPYITCYMWRRTA